MNFFSATPLEAAILTELEQICFGTGAWNEAQIVSHLEHGGKILLATGLQGYLVYLENEAEAEVLRIGVRPEHRKSGLATGLLHKLVALAAEKTVFLEVKESNEAAVNLYRKSGFIQAGTRKKYYSDGANALLFVLNFSHQ